MVKYQRITYLIIPRNPGHVFRWLQALRIMSYDRKLLAVFPENEYCNELNFVVRCQKEFREKKILVGHHQYGVQQKGLNP